MRNHTYVMIILVKINLLFSVLELVIEIFDKSKKSVRSSHWKTRRAFNCCTTEKANEITDLEFCTVRKPVSGKVEKSQSKACEEPK